MWGFLFFELCHYSVVSHRYCLLIRSAEWPTLLEIPLFVKTFYEGISIFCFELNILILYNENSTND